MKSSKRYMGATLLAILALPVLIVFYSRFIAPPRELQTPERTPAAQLAALRDFTSIHVEGDFALEIGEAANYAFAYEPLSDTRGELVATVDNGTLRLRGFGNRNEPNTPARVRISVPDLHSLDVSFVTSLRISGLSVEELDLRIVQVRSVTVENNTIGTLNVRSIANGPLEFDGNSIATTVFRVIGGESTITTRD